MIAYNSELMNLYEDVDIISFIRLSTLRWIGHVNRMDKERNIFYNQPQGIRVRGMPKNRWMDCVLSDIEKCKITNWKEQSRERGIWRRSNYGGEGLHWPVVPMKKKKL